MRNDGRRSGFAFLASFAAAAPAIAEEQAERAVHGIGDLFWPVLNFAIFCLVLYRFAWPIVRTALADRRVLIERSLLEAERIRSEAAAELREVEALRAALPAEAERVTETIRAEAERERAATVASARRSAERIRAEARAAADQEAARAIAKVRADIAAEVAKRAEALVRAKLDDGDQRRFVRGFLSDLDAGAEG